MIVDEHVDGAEAGHGLLDALGGRRLIGDVGADEEDVVVAELLHGCRAPVGVELGHDHLGALGPEPFGVGQADALPGAGHDGHLAVESHRRSSDLLTGRPGMG
jgi:hypothetical protein